jgi:hypothetical protein
MRQGAERIQGEFADENAMRITAPNPELMPEQHKVFRTRLAYYFRCRSPGQLSLTLAQNEATSVVFSMPKAAIDAGAACEVLAIDRMSSVIAARMNA